jgi:hypothetical protein
MKTIAIVSTKDADGNDAIAPAEPLPPSAIAIVCDGGQYTVYELGDTLPEQEVVAA